MGHFHFANCTKKIISIVLLMIICISTVTYAVTDAEINDIYNKVITGTECAPFMAKLYATGQTLETPLSNSEIDTKMRSFVTYVLKESQHRVDIGTIDKTNFNKEIVSICNQKALDYGLLSLFLAAYEELALLSVLDNVSINDVPEQMKPMYLLLGNSVKTMFNLNPIPSVAPSIAPTTPTPIDTGGGTGGTGGGTTTPITPVITPVSVDTFNDLQSVSWAVTAINTLAQAGVISKNDEMKFEPLNNVKREEFVKLIVSGFNLKNPNATSNFIDVDKDSWFYPYVSSMSMLNLVKGFNNSFGTGQDITRQDIAVLLYRVMQYVGIDVTPSEPELFNDDAQISDYAKDSVYIMRQIGIIKGTPENTFEPTSFATRAEAAQMIYNTYKIYIAKK